MLVVIESVIPHPRAPVALAADAAVLCVELGRTSLADARETLSFSAPSGSWVASPSPRVTPSPARAPAGEGPRYFRTQRYGRQPRRHRAALPGASLARNALHLVIGQVATMVLGILFSAALGRKLGAGDFGLYFLISSFSAFALVVVDWGQQYFGIREVAAPPERGGDLLGTGLVLRTVGTRWSASPPD